VTQAAETRQAAADASEPAEAARESDADLDIKVPAKGPAWQKHSPPRPGWVYSLAKWLLGPALLVLFKVRVEGKDRVPATGPVIIAGNHLSYMDPLIVCLAEPRSRPVHFMAKLVLFNHGPFFSWLLRSLHAFPVRRGTADRESIATATDILRRGGIVGIFPEGTRIRGGKVSEGQEGAAFIAMHAGVPIVPVGICGTDRIQPPGDTHWHLVPLNAYFGKPIDPASFVGKRKERLEAMTAAVMAAIDDAKYHADCAKR
jgi:1-acyl-sn-glycerol-3-phosphate acyltransferase